MRNMLRLPRETHCYLIEPVSEQFHMKSLVSSRFLGFISRIRNSNKEALRNMLKTIEYDTRSVTGGNLRKILLMSEERDVKNLTPKHGYINYRITPEGCEYIVEFINTLIELRENPQSTDVSLNEIDNMLSFLCIS